METINFEIMPNKRGALLANEWNKQRTKNSTRQSWTVRNWIDHSLTEPTHFFQSHILLFLTDGVEKKARNENLNCFW